jgi:hypothetical protein
MKTTLTLLRAGAVSAFAFMLSATLAHATDPQSLILEDVSGAVRIQQDLPCGSRLDLRTSIVRGYMQMTVFQMARGQVLVDLTRLNMFLAPFRVEANCNGVRGTVDFREIGVQLASAVRFKAQSTPESGLVYFTIPKEQFRIYKSVLSDAPAPYPGAGYQRPSEDVTGVADPRRQTVELHIVLANELYFRAGCDGDRCAIDERRTGTITSDIRARDSSDRPPSSRN